MEKTKWGHIWVTQDMLLTEKPALISGVIITARNTKTASVTIRRGSSSSSPIFCKLKVSGDDSEQFNFYERLYFDNGIYIDVDNITEGVLITWKPL